MINNSTNIDQQNEPPPLTATHTNIKKYTTTIDLENPYICNGTCINNIYQ